MANDLNFDFAGAEAAGVSRQAILKEIEKSGKVNFDFAGARKAGISDDDIYQELSSRSQQIDTDNIVPGPPEEEGETTAEVKVGEITAVPDTTPEGTPIMQGSLDTQTTAPSMPIIGEKGAPTTLTSTPTAIEEETARRESTPEGAKAGQVSGLQQPAEGIAYRDPVTGEVKSTATEAGAVEPAYDILFGPGGKLGTFGILTPQASVEAGKIVGKKSLEVAQAIDDLFQQHPAAGLGDALSKEAKYILNRNPNVTEEQVIEALQGVKTADQAYALSRMLGETGYIRQAVRADSDAAAGALRADLETARDKILQTVGNVDIAHAKAKYADMVQEVAGDYKNVHNATPILQDLDFLERFYGVTPSAGNRVVSQMKAALSDNPNINLSDALEFRGDLNYLIGKATRGREKVKLGQIKDNLDSFINSVATPEQKTMIDNAIGTYARTMQNRDVLDLVAKNTKDGIAVNWTKLHRDLNEANLRSPEAVDALRIAEAFSKRFGNDKKLLSIAMPQGSSPDSGGVLGAWGYVINHLKDTLAVYGNRAENLKIQKAILKSIKSGTTNLDFVNKLKANGDVPDEVSKIFEDLLQIPYKAGARQTGDVNLEPIVTPVGGRDMAVPKVTEEIPTTKPSAPKNLRERYVDPQSRVSELLDKETRTFEESAELKKLQDQLIEEGTGHKEGLVKPTSFKPSSDLLDDEEAKRLLGNLSREGRYDNMSEAELLAKRNEMVNIPKRNRDAAWQQEWEDVNNAYARAPAASNKLPSTKPPKVDTTVENPYSRVEDERTNNSVDPGNIEQFRLFNDLPIRKVTDKLEEAMASLSNGNTVTINGKTFDKFHLYYNDDGEVSISQPLLDAVSNRPSTINKVEQAQQKFDTIVRDIRRLERVPAGQRTAEQSTQLAEMRRARLTARNNIERATHGGAKANTLLSSLRNSEHSVNVTDRGSGNYTIEFNGNRVSATVRSNNTVSLNTTGFREGSGEGAKFYKELYKALDTAGLKHNITSLTPVNTMRLPINIYKHKLETGNLPIAGGQQKLQALMSNAIRKINMVAGRDIKHMNDGQLEELARRTGPLANIHAGVNSLKLYRKAARLLSDGRALSVGALAPLINSAYSEIEEN